MVRDEGVIKFTCRLIEGAAPSYEATSDLILYRQKLFALGLIGVYPDGIGFGNISRRLVTSGSEFLISASQTGGIELVEPKHFVTVTEYSLGENWVECRGQMNASSESLTHAMIYSTFSAANAIIHVHHNRAWSCLQGRLITSAPDVPYGTPDMANEVQRLARETNLSEEKIFVMAGHEDGILSFGKDLLEAYEILERHVDSLLG
jgi:L-ribulose-5-phosphate 4-epimerase